MADNNTVLDEANAPVVDMGATPTLDVDGAMAILELNRAAVYRKVKDGELAGQKAGGRLTFERTAVEALQVKLLGERQSRLEELNQWLETLKSGVQPEAEPLAEDASDVDRLAEVGHRLLRAALAGSAGDIYVDPVVDGDRIVFHAAGRRQEQGKLSAKLAPDLKNWLKGKATVVAAADGSGQGIGHIERQGAQHQFRVDVVPTLMGEHIHVRLFEATTSLEKLGFSESQIQALRHCLAMGSGLVLLADAADAWSQRHRRALSQELSAAGRLVVCFEHRLQYRSELLVQLDLAAEGRPPLADLWRSALAMDPDALVVDELIDAEAARLAIDSASGCIVVAQMMAADADSARRRLAKWEIDMESLDAHLLAVVERVHVRRLCSACRREVDGDGESGRHFVAVGCSSCGDGYDGVQAVCGLHVSRSADSDLELEAHLARAVEAGVTSADEPRRRRDAG